MNASGKLGQAVGWYGYTEHARAQPGLGGIGAILWSLNQLQAVEIKACVPDDVHLVCLHLSGRFDWECEVGTRRYRTPGLTGTLNIASSGETGRMIMSSARAEALHVLVPISLFDCCAGDLSPGLSSRAIELIDPMNGPDQFATGLGNGIARALRDGSVPSLLEVQGLGLALSAHLLRTHSNRRGQTRDVFKGGLADWQVRRCTEYLIDRIACDVPLSALADEARLSPYHFARAFKKSTGLAPHAYQLNLRIERAKMLLATSQLPVTQIAFDVGYDSPQALARVFMRRVGCSPSNYRRRFC